MAQNHPAKDDADERPDRRKAREMVIARYGEDVRWAEKWNPTIYNKGSPLTAGGIVRSLPNVGRESHTYLYHILNYWDQLADRTLFSQGKIQDHLPEGVRVEQFFDESVDLVFPRIVRDAKWTDAGRLVYPGIFGKMLRSGNMRPSRYIPVEWFRKFLDKELNDPSDLVYIPGAIFSVTRGRIHSMPKRFYQNLIEQVSDHPNPEEGHYIERAWMYVFTSSPCRGRDLSDTSA
jgi:hypothetical protein